MNDNAPPIEILFEKIEDYSKKKLELLKLNTVEKSADVISALVTQLIIILMVGMTILIGSIGVAFWIGEILGAFYYGFFIIAGFYSFMAISAYIFRNSLLKVPVNNAIISQILEQKKL